MRVLTGEKLHTMQLMVEEERRNVEQLRQEMAVSQQVGRRFNKEILHFAIFLIHQKTYFQTLAYLLAPVVSLQHFNENYCFNIYL